MTPAAVAGALLLAVLAGCASGPGPAPPHQPRGAPLVLENADVELDPAPGRDCPLKWGCSMHADPGSFRFRVDESVAANGRRSLAVVRVRDEPWAVATQTVWLSPRHQGARMRYSLAVRSLSEGGAGAGAIFTAQNGSGVQVALAKRHAPSDGRWHRVELEFTVPERAVLIEVGGVLEGAGPAWFDDAHLELVEARAG